MPKLISTNTIKKDYPKDDLSYLLEMLKGVKKIQRTGPIDHFDSCLAPIGAPLKYYGSKQYDKE